MSSPIATTHISNPPLELLVCLPPHPPPHTKPPVLFLHGASCSARDYNPWLPHFAHAGYPSYALSLRGHGTSWRPSWLTYTFFNTLDDYASDVAVAVAHIRALHADSVPVLVGHSFGGGVLQYCLSTDVMKARKLVLVASANLEGNIREIAANWEKVEAPEGYAWPWTGRCRLNSVEEVRSVFFSDETGEGIVKEWLEECKAEESARAGLGAMWGFGEGEKVLEGISGEGADGKRKMLCLSAKRDLLTTPEMVKRNVEGYRGIMGRSVVDLVEVSRGGHHVMMDIGSGEAANVIIRWLDVTLGF